MTLMKVEVCNMLAHVHQLYTPSQHVSFLTCLQNCRPLSQQTFRLFIVLRCGGGCSSQVSQL